MLCIYVVFNSNIRLSVYIIFDVISGTNVCILALSASFPLPSKMVSGIALLFHLYSYKYLFSCGCFMLLLLRQCVFHGLLPSKTAKLTTRQIESHAGLYWISSSCFFDLIWAAVVRGMRPRTRQ